MIIFISSFDLSRPSTAPSPADTLQNRPNTGLLSSLRTGLEPTKSSDLFSPTRTTADSNKSTNWLGLTGESSDEDQPPPRGTPKTEPVVTTFVKKPPIAPIQEVTPAVIEQPKKSVLDAFLENDRRALTEKIIPPATNASNNTAQDFWLDDRSNSNKRLTTGGISKTPPFTDNQQIKSSTNKSLFDTKNDSGN